MQHVLGSECVPQQLFEVYAMMHMFWYMKWQKCNIIKPLSTAYVSSACFFFLTSYLFQSICKAEWNLFYSVWQNDSICRHHFPKFSSCVPWSDRREREQYFLTCVFLVNLCHEETSPDWLWQKLLFMQLADNLLELDIFILVCCCNGQDRTDIGKVKIETAHDAFCSSSGSVWVRFWNSTWWHLDWALHI